MAIDQDKLTELPDRPCPQHGHRAASDPNRWLSTHRTSAGIVVYYRCSCDRPAVTVLRPGWGPCRRRGVGGQQDR